MKISSVFIIFFYYLFIFLNETEDSLYKAIFFFFNFFLKKFSYLYFLSVFVCCINYTEENLNFPASVFLMIPFSPLGNFLETKWHIISLLSTE